MKRLLIWILIIVGCHQCLWGLQPSVDTEAGPAHTLLPNGDTLLSGGLDSKGNVSGEISLAQPGSTASVIGHLHHARVGHSTTVLPNGTVLIFGGIGTSGHLVRQMEIFDPTTNAIHDIESYLVPRAFHTATVLTSGEVIIVGGVTDAGTYTNEIQKWDFRTLQALTIPGRLSFVRQGHTATLLTNGGVLITGGKGPNDKPVQADELFGPSNDSITQVNQGVGLQPAGPIQLAASIPQDGAKNVPLNQLLAFRFTTPADVQSVDASKIILSHVTGAQVEATVIAAEAGRIGFLLPASPLQPGTEYQATISGIYDANGNEIPPQTIHFETEEDAASAADELWIPGVDAMNGNWNSQTGDSRWQKLPPLQAGAGVTAVSGQVLRLNGFPLAKVTLSIGNTKSTTDTTGRFLLSNLHAGRQVLVIDGRTANRPGVAYGLYEVAIDVVADKTNVLNYTVWMTRLDTGHAVQIPSPTTAPDTVVTNPLLPGLELHIPQNTVIVDHEGRPVRWITITPIPLDKPPFPLPLGVRVPIYFTIQPGGAYIDVRAPNANKSSAKGARLIYPNLYHEHPGTTFDFWNYDASSKGWYIYGRGTVDDKGDQVIPQPGVVIYGFSGAMVADGSAASAAGGPYGRPLAKGADPVDLSTGQFTYTKADFTLPDTIPIRLTRTYLATDTRVRPFGVGTTHNYDIFNVGDTNPYTYQEIILPNGGRVRFNRTSSGTSYGDAVYEHTAADGPYYGAIITWNGNGWNLRMRDGTLLTFPESSGQSNQDCQALLSITDPHGNQLKINRDGSCRITSIVSPNGRYLSFQYDPQNRITSISDNIGNTVGYQYDANGNLWIVTDANGNTTTFTYDPSHLMLTVTDGRQIEYIQNQYDSNGRVITQTLADGGVYHFNWTASNNSSQLWQMNCNNCGGILNRYDLNQSEGYLGLVSSVTITDPRGYQRTVQFNNFGFISTDTAALGQPEQQTITHAYYSDNLPKSDTDQLGRVTSYDYDVIGNLATFTQLSGTPGAITWTSTYDQTYSRMLTIADPLNHTTNFGYDQYGSLLSVTDPLGHGLTMTYNGTGQILSVADSLNDTAHFGYLGGDLVSITDPNNNTTTRYVDYIGRVLAVTDPLGNATRYQYDPAGDLTQITDALGGITKLQYDQNYNLHSVTDTRNNATVFGYENMDRLSSRMDPLQRHESYMYDTNGNVVSYTDRKGQVSNYTYDGLDRRVGAAFGVVNGQAQSTIAYYYDGGDRMYKAIDSISGTVTRSYDDLNRLTGETTPQSSISYQYDAANRRQTAQIAGQTQVQFGWDSANRLQTVTQGSTSSGFQYDAANRRSQLTLPNGIVAAYSYDFDSQLTGISYTLSGNLIGNLSYGYDAAGNRTAVGGSLANSNIPSATTSASYDSANELTNWNGTQFHYDANGNTTSDGSNSYTWDSRNHLLNINSWILGYDFEGRRTLTTATRSIQYDGFQPAAEYNGTTLLATTLSFGIDQFLARSTQAGTYYPLTDGVGSVIAMTDGAAKIQTQYLYDPYGKTTATGLQLDNPYQFTGREAEAVGLYYNRARYYNPTIGRFISEDPIGFRGGANLYAYAADSPTNFIDPFGMDKKKPCAANNGTPPLMAGPMRLPPGMNPNRTPPGAPRASPPPELWPPDPNAPSKVPNTPGGSNAPFQPGNPDLPSLNLGLANVLPWLYAIGRGATLAGVILTPQSTAAGCDDILCPNGYDPNAPPPPPSNPSIPPYNPGGPPTTNPEADPLSNSNPGGASPCG